MYCLIPVDLTHRNRRLLRFPSMIEKNLVFAVSARLLAGLYKCIRCPVPPTSPRFLLRGPLSMRALPYIALSFALVSTVSCFSEEAAQIPWDTGTHETYWSSGNRAWNAPPDPDTDESVHFQSVDSLLHGCLIICTETVRPMGRISSCH